jgi:hypothetical protein
MPIVAFNIKIVKYLDGLIGDLHLKKRRGNATVFFTISGARFLSDRNYNYHGHNIVAHLGIRPDALEVLEKFAAVG